MLTLTQSGACGCRLFHDYNRKPKPTPTPKLRPKPNPACNPAADLFHGDNPNMEPLGRGDFTEFMAWRERHAADTVLPESEMVRSGFRSLVP